MEAFVVFRHCKWNAIAMSAVFLLSIWSGVSFSQSNNGQKPAETKNYDLPQPLLGFEASNGVSSEEFEKLIGLNSYSTTSLEPETPNAPPLAQIPSPSPIVSLAPKLQGVPIQSDAFAPTNNGGLEEGRVVDGNWTPWWQETCSKAILTPNLDKAIRFDLEQLIWLSMEHSPRVKSILITPKIQNTDIEMARGDFDPRRFAKTNYKDSSEPVGNTLTTGGPTRLNEQFWENSIGIRDRNAFGGRTELSQLIIARDNNSLFFKPNNQADTKLSLNYTQPLLRGSGRDYNTSSVRIAGIKTRESIAEANQALQNHAWDIVRTYWEMVLQRYLLEQSRNGQDRLQQIKKMLLNRQGRDLVKTHLSRANAAIYNQKAQIEKYKVTILGLQASLRRLVNAPELDESNCNEIVPLTMPTTEKLTVPLHEELLLALEHRGDIVAVQERIEQAMVQKGLAISELRPQLDFEMESYVKGLRGNNEVGQALVNQLDSGRPSLSAMLIYQNPVGNRSAKANRSSREMEIVKLQLDYSDALKKAYADITTSILSAEGTYQMTLASIESTLSTRDEVDGHKAHFEDFLGDNPSPSNVLNDLLDSEVRLINAENSWATRQIDHMLAIMKIKYESGLLMTITAEAK